MFKLFSKKSKLESNNVVKRFFIVNMKKNDNLISKLKSVSEDLEACEEYFINPDTGEEWVRYIM